MAIMATQNAERVAFERKTSPVASDLEINGTSIHHDASLESNAALSESALSLEASPLNNPISETVTHNSNNADAYLSNQTIGTSPIDTQSNTDPSSLDLKADQSLSAESQENNTAAIATNSSLDDPIFGDPQPVPSTVIESAINAANDSAIESALDIKTAPSTIPPIIDAKESDIRHTETLDPKSVSSRAPIVQPEISDPPVKDETTSPKAVNGQNEDTKMETKTPTEGSLLNEPQPAKANASSTQAEGSLEGEDVEMADVPASQAKVSREREDDTETQPSAKRAKTGDVVDVSKGNAAKGDESVTATQAETPNAAETGVSSPKQITPYASKEIIKVLRNGSRSAAGRNFKDPVHIKWPDFAAAYAAKVPNPMYLDLIVKKLEDQEYTSTAGLEVDLNLIHSNAALFNGPEHNIAKQAVTFVEATLSKIASIGAEPPAPAPKVPKKPARRAAAEDGAAARKPSRVNTTTPEVAPGQTFPLDPNTNLPLIRRDSTKDDGGRPKRQIHPPKNKDILYSSARPKNKKFAPELKFCEDVVLAELNKPKNGLFMNPFMQPVDPVALGIPHYHSVIKSPMDISTVTDKLNAGQYTRAKDFESDIKLIIANCFKFNPTGNPVRAMGESFQRLFNELWAKKDQYIIDHTPAAQSPSINGDSEDESEEEEDDEEPVAAGAAAAASVASMRLIEEQTKLITLMANKKTDPNILKMQQDMVEFLKSKIEETPALPAKKAKKSKPAKGAKKSAPAKKPAQSTKKGGPRKKQLNTIEKEIISRGIGRLPDEAAADVIEMIREVNPEVVNDSDGEMELDIDTISEPILWKIYDMIMKFVPEVEKETKEELFKSEEPPKPAQPVSKPKKHKPMSKVEQEAKIELLKHKLGQGSGSQEPVLPGVIPTVEQPDEPESSGDDSSSEEE